MKRSNRRGEKLIGATHLEIKAEWSEGKVSVGSDGRIEN
jgi:hypothetical protein